MQGPYLRKYGEATTITFSLWEVDGVDLRVDASFATGDMKIMKDEGAEANMASAFVDEGQGYSIACTATEMTAARCVIYAVDSATKVWLDETIHIETYGHASAQHAFDLDTAVQSVTVSDKTGFSLVVTGLDAIVSTGTGAIEIAKATWDRVLSGATHNIATSAGRRLRNIQDFGIYDMASVWVDEVAGSSTGTTDGEDATVSNRADDFDNAQTIAASVGLDHIHVQNGNTITLAATLNGYWVWGEIWTLALGGQDVGASAFSNATVSGTGTGTTPKFWDCIIGTATLSPATFYNCSFTTTMTMGSAGAFRLIDCQSGVAGAGSPTIDMGAAVGATTLELRRWSGGITLNNLASGDVVTIGGSDMGTITLNGADASVEIRGIFKAVTNNLTGSPTVTASGAKGTDIAEILVDTGTTLPGLIGTPAADLSADIAAVKVDTAATLVDTGTTLPATLTSMSGATFATGTDSLEAIRNRGDAAWTTGAGGGSSTDQYQIVGGVTGTGTSVRVDFGLLKNGELLASTSLSTAAVVGIQQGATDLTFSESTNTTDSTTDVVTITGTITQPTANQMVNARVTVISGATTYDGVVMGSPHST